MTPRSPQYFCYCGACRGDSRILNVENEHFAVCHPRRCFWLIGKNYFNGWLLENEEVWQLNRELLDRYDEILPEEFSDGLAA